MPDNHGAICRISTNQSTTVELEPEWSNTKRITNECASCCSSSGFPCVGVRLVYSSLRCTATLVIRFHWSLLLAFSLHFSSSSAFLRSLFTQSSHLSCGLPRFLQPSCFIVSDLFGNFSSFILTMCPAHFIRLLTLFLIYINDFPEYLQHSTLRLFADDSIIYKEIKTINDAQNLQLDLDAACRWEKDWLMHFHPDKCNLISITQKRKPIHFTYKLHDHPLAKVEHSKYLGITLQSNLKWNKHINSITNKANQSLGFLKRNLKIKSSAVKSHAYKAFVRPKLEYEIRRTRVRLIMFYKIIHHVVAIHPLDTLLLPTTTITRYNSSHTYQHIRTDKDSYKYSFYPRTIIQWNLLPIHVHEAVTVDAFKALVPVTVLAPIYHV